MCIINYKTENETYFAILKSQFPNSALGTALYWCIEHFYWNSGLDILLLVYN